MPDRDQLAQQALSLAPEDRAYIADKLEQSLTTGGFATPEIAAAWIAEIERRIEAYERGEVEARPADVVLERIRQSLKDRRARKVSP
jgi:putative addiction module component (TIGR02574 family)